MALHDARVSQLLPTIKCNTCGEPIEFRKLSEHICSELPDVPTLPTQYRNQPQKSVDRSFKDESILNLEDNRASLTASEASSFDQEDSLSDIFPTRTRKKQPTREPPTADYASRFAKETENVDADNQTANFLERYDQLIGNKSSPSSPIPKSPPSYIPESTDPRSRKPNLTINTNRDSNEEMYQHRKKSSGSRSSSENARSPPSSKDDKAYKTRSERSSASSSSTTTRSIDVTTSGRPRPDDCSPRSPASTQRQNSVDLLSPSALRPPADAFFDMRVGSPRLEKVNDDGWSNPRPAPKPSGQPFRGGPMSPSVLNEFSNLNLESTRPAPPPPPSSSGHRTPNSSHRNGDGQSISRSRTAQYSDNPGSSSVRGRSPAPPSGSSRHVRRTSGSSSSSSGASSSSLSRSRDAPPVPRDRTSDEQVRSNQLGVSADLHVDEPLSPASRPGSHRHCTTCRNKIGGAGAIHLSETSYHRTCFRCAECRTQLDVTDEYKEVKGRVLCGNCTPATSTISPPSSSVSRGPPICAGCNGTITGKYIKALGSFWHDVHLQCAHCRQPLTRGHVEHRGRAYCPEDFTHLFLPKCKGCTKPVEREALVALDGKWHARCFNCQVCHKPFPNKSFYVFQKQPFCKYHYHMLNNSLCKRCESPIEGPCAQVLEGRFHPQCFSCETCEVALTDVYYNFQGRFFCEHDVTVIQRRMNMKADRRKTMIKNI